jgi:FixJ family two-component response regulator
MATEHPCIAVVDDEAPVRKALQRLLRSFGMQVHVFPSGREFLDAIETLAIDCVVLDLHMPGVNGFEVQSAIATSGKKLPVVVVTGHDTPETRARVLTAGAAAYLLKPIDEQVLLGAIALAMRGGDPGR